MEQTTATTTNVQRARGRATGALLPDELRLGAARLVVTDLERSIRFYEGVIGMVVQDRSQDTAALGTREGAVVLELEQRPDARPAGRHAGLYHVALLFPSRQELARVAVRIARSGTAIEGASDHGTHEAIYLPDPDRNGLELAADRPRGQWPNLADIEEIRPRPLDVPGLLSQVEGEPPTPAVADGLVVGHQHLHVGDVEEAVAFWRDVVGFEVVTRLDVAAFLSTGGYHHHLAVNTWRGVGVGPAPADAVGLRWWSAVVPSTAHLDALERRLRDAGADHHRDQATIVLRDPWRIELRVTVG